MNVRGAYARNALPEVFETTVVPLRLATTTPSGRLWMLSLWYRFDDADGVIECATSTDAAVVDYLEADPEVAFEISTNEVPYRGVRGNGLATVAPDPEKETLEALLVRYLGSTDTPLGRRLLSPERTEVRIEIDPRSIYGWDFRDRMADG